MQLDIRFIVIDFIQLLSGAMKIVINLMPTWSGMVEEPNQFAGLGECLHDGAVVCLRHLFAQPLAIINCKLQCMGKTRYPDHFSTIKAVFMFPAFSVHPECYHLLHITFIHNFMNL